jgi:predicted N-formylglutamate amidohydrolase
LTNEAFRQLSAIDDQQILIVVDHASNHVPPDIDLGITSSLLQEHIAWDIGVAAIAERMAGLNNMAALLGGTSRLVVDLNRYEDEDGVIPAISDGIEIAGNLGLGSEQLSSRLDRFFRPYHDRLAEILETHPPQLVLSLHSFTPHLSSRPEEMRPWQIGVLYNQDDRAARIAIPLFENENLIVGDQEPYSGKLLNATMNRHCEASGIPYLGVEIRQDLIADEAGQAEWSNRLTEICQKVALKLGQ